MKDMAPEIVVVATPTEFHHQAVMDVFAAGRPQAVLCEKPLAYGIKQAQQIVEVCDRHDCGLYVNYFRHSMPGVAEVRARLTDGRIGNPVNGVAWYSKGLLNSGSHLLNLLQSLLGEVEETRVIRMGRLWRDIDPEPDLDIEFAAGRVVFLAAREEHFFHNAIELIAPNGRLRFEAGGAQILWQGLDPDARFKGYVRLNETGESIPADFDRIQWYVADQLAEALEGRTAHLCTGAAALRTQEVLANFEVNR